MGQFPKFYPLFLRLPLVSSASRKKEVCRVHFLGGGGAPPDTSCQLVMLTLSILLLWHISALVAICEESVFLGKSWSLLKQPPWEDYWLGILRWSGMAMTWRSGDIGHCPGGKLFTTPCGHKPVDQNFTDSKTWLQLILFKCCLGEF